MTKVLEVYEMFLVRHGFMIVGLPFAGKTCCYRTLASALSLLHAEEGEDEVVRKVNTPCLNPKSVPPGRLYGEFDAVSHEWTDGIPASTARARRTRRASAVDGLRRPRRRRLDREHEHRPRRQQALPDVGRDHRDVARANLLFEPMDLAVASPATVSRCGMVYMEPHSLGWQPLMSRGSPAAAP